MTKHELTPEQLARIQESQVALARHIERVGVDRSSAMRRLSGEISSRTRVSETESVVNVMFDADAMLRALEELPDKAGTDAFVAGYERIKATEAAIMRHIARAKVDMASALPKLRGAPIQEEALILSILERLPAGAGTDRFVAAYNARVDGRDTPHV